MTQEVQTLKDLPLESLISAPLNAVIAAQANAAMSTAAFIERLGFKAKESDALDLSMLFDDGDSNYEVRNANITFEKKVGTETEEVKLSVPYITLFNIPSIEIEEMTWDFNVKLKRAEVFSTSLSISNETKVNANTSFNLGGGFLPIKIGSSLKVESTTKTDFNTKFGLSKEAEYNLKISVKATQAAPPKGLEKLLSIAEQLAG